MLHIHFFKKGGSRKQRKNEEASITYGQHGLPGEVTSKKKEKASFANKQKKKVPSIAGRTAARTTNAPGEGSMLFGNKKSEFLECGK